jgi:PAS domain S-box-containing protein
MRSSAQTRPSSLERGVEPDVRPDLGEGLIRSLLEASTDPVYVKDAAGHFLLLNDAAAEVLGMSAAEVIGKTHWDVFPIETAAALHKADEAVLRTGERVALEITISSPTGDRIWADTKAPFRDRSGAVIGVVGMARDVTAYRKREQALEMREQQLTEAQRLARLGSWQYDIVENRVTWSEDLYIVHGVDPSEAALTVERALDVIHPADRERARDIVEYASRTGAPFEFEYRATRSDGDEVTVLCRGLVIRDDAGDPVRMIGTGQDVTAHSVAEKALREAIAEAERANEAKSKFLSRMSHELRTPLNAILGFGQVMESETGRKDREGVDQILRAGRHLLSLIDEILDLSKIEAGKIALATGPVSLNEVVCESMELIRPTADERGIRLEMGPALEGAPFVTGDSRRLKQVMLNLLSNAVKYNRPGGRVQVVCTARGAGVVRIEVSDTGHGMTREQVRCLFRPFDRVGAEWTDTEGTGLGLALSKGLLEAMGGQLGVESTPGRGSTFWIQLRRARAPEPPATLSAAPQSQARATPAACARVLYIEDNAANLRLLERLFSRRSDLEMITATTGGGGLEAADQSRPDLILLDVQLPDMNGDEVLWRLRQNPALRDIPVVAISGDATAQQMKRLMDLGAQEYLTKPLDLPEVLQTVDWVLDAARQTRSDAA